MTNKITIKNIFKHFYLINKHRWYVFKFCCKAGIPWRGLIHDLSKYSPTEFFESVKYYTGNRSPIDVCKELNGYSKAWLHHNGRNRHHYEYWQDNFDSGTSHLIMPFKESLEMLCDYLGAAKAYMGNDFSYEKEFNWYLNKKGVAKAMHPVTKEFLYAMLYIMKEGINLNYKLAKKVYKEILNAYKLHNEGISDKTKFYIYIYDNKSKKDINILLKRNVFLHDKFYIEDISISQ